MDQGNFVFMAWLLLIERRYAGVEKWAGYVDPYCDVLLELIWLPMVVITRGTHVNVHLLSWSVFMVCHIVPVIINTSASSPRTGIREVTFGDTFQTASDEKVLFYFHFYHSSYVRRTCRGVFSMEMATCSLCHLLSVVVTCRRVEGKDRI